MLLTNVIIIVSISAAGLVLFSIAWFAKNESDD